jgi:3D (Asp-Asp-Asp) domain-containing protein
MKIIEVNPFLIAVLVVVWGVSVGFSKIGYENKITKLQSTIKEKDNQIECLKQDLDELSISKCFKVDVTAYSPTKRETDSTPFITASNKRVQEGYIAISRDLEPYLKFGDQVYIEGLGTYEVQDRMNKRWRNKVDVFFCNTKDAWKFGKLKNLKMWKLGCNMKKKKTLFDKAVEKGTVPAISLALVAGNLEANEKLTNSIIKDKNKRIEKLEAELAEQKEYVHRIQKRFNHFFFEAPKYESKDGRLLPAKMWLMQEEDF